MDLELQKIFRESRSILRDTAARGFRSQSDFNQKAAWIVDTLTSRAENDMHFAHTVAEAIPRLFAADVSTGYSFFHNDGVIEKVWSLYNRAAKTAASSLSFRPPERRREPPFKTACVTAIFSDAIGPSKDIAELASYLDRKLFEPVLISTNQFYTVKRVSGDAVKPGQHNTYLGLDLERNGIELVSIPEQDSVLELSKRLVMLCAERDIDIVITNGSVFSFPEACLAASGAALSLFDFHRGFPLYADGVDAIMHWLKSTRETQLGPWIRKGGRVIDYNYMIKPPEIKNLPKKDDGMVFFITAGNHMEKRLSPEFRAVVEKLMKEFPQTRYKLVGACDPERVKAMFDPSLGNRFEFTGPVGDPAMMTAHFANADIYLNEFPEGGGRVVLEAMSCYLPVAAMKCGALHVENIGAEQVGEEFAINERSPERYYSFVKNLVLSKNTRRDVGRKMRKRIEDVYDFQKNVDLISSQILEIHNAKLRAGSGGQSPR
jgi:glycosyltransferase involved in cell wall biosynthesis